MPSFLNRKDEEEKKFGDPGYVFPPYAKALEYKQESPEITTGEMLRQNASPTLDPLGAMSQTVAQALREGPQYPEMPESLKAPTVKEVLKNNLVSMIPFYGWARDEVRRAQQAQDLSQYQESYKTAQTEWDELREFSGKVLEAEMENHQKISAMYSKVLFAKQLFPNVDNSAILAMLGVNPPKPQAKNLDPQMVIPRSEDGTQVWDREPVMATFNDINGKWSFRDPWTGSLRVADSSGIVSAERVSTPQKETQVRPDDFTDESGFLWHVDPVTHQAVPVKDEAGNRIKGPQATKATKGQWLRTVNEEGEPVYKYTEPQPGAEVPIAPTYTERKAGEARKHVKRMYDSVMRLAEHLITEKDAYKQRAKALGMTFDAYIARNPEFLAYQDLKDALGFQIAREKESGRISDQDAAIWIRTLPDVAGDTIDSMNIKRGILDPVATGYMKGQNPESSKPKTKAKTKIEIGKTYTDNTGKDWEIIGFDDEGNPIGVPANE